MQNNFKMLRSMMNVNGWALFVLVHYFHLMLHSHILCPDHHTIPFVLIACGNALLVVAGEQMHNWVVKNGLALADGHLGPLIRFSAKCQVLEDARKLFGEIPNRDVVQCNVLISGYVDVVWLWKVGNFFRVCWYLEWSC
ncbi:unnamed protein product [Ilex paraguariensis]|uniref:Uncharacterized protein n=1 Tax=Ilex paraguariensis TaxID=185542 RepID=A0ABC8U0U5_9AQUA